MWQHQRVDVKRAIFRVVLLGLVASAVAACAEEPQATIYEAEESQLPSNRTILRFCSRAS